MRQIGNSWWDDELFAHTLLGKVFDIMQDGNYYTIAAVAQKTGHEHNQSSVSAAIRSLRNHGIEVERIRNPAPNQQEKYVYRIANFDYVKPLSYKTPSKAQSLFMEMFSK